MIIEHKVMKTLVNKDNPAIRITAPEVEVYDKYYYIKNARLEILQEYWTLVEEEPKHTEVWVEGRTIFEQEGEPTEGIKGNLEEIPSNVDLEKTIEEEKDHYFAIKDRGFNLDSIDVERIARRFYYLGKGGSK